MASRASSSPEPTEGVKVTELRQPFRPTTTDSCPQKEVEVLGSGKKANRSKSTPDKPVPEEGKHFTLGLTMLKIPVLVSVPCHYLASFSLH